MPGLGEAFRAAREARNLSLSDVAEQIHIRAVYLQAIEEEDWSAIAAPVYVRGFIRTYARFLGLDPQTAIEQFNAVAGEPAVTAPTVAGTPARSGPSPWLLIGGAVAAILVGLVAFNYLQLQRSSTDGHPLALASPGSPAGSLPAVNTTGAPTPAASVQPAVPASGTPLSDATGPAASPGASPAPAAGSGAAAPSPKGSPAPLAISVTQKSWLRVTVDGQTKDEGVFDPGAHLQYSGKAATVRAGNAAGVDVRVNGKDQGSLGKPGDVVERSFELGHG
jgi:cytoskeletal protein RodZ